ncbi:hypothetical protein J4733_06035 [Klebsiella pneumoniae]|uniref:Uncharacterized protein n=1 Tax=Klebsiella pneumoniae TaxID=573 RepID=A0A939NR89_KLEPN|nr:hypothetical protein [Klebsiella pneumoniae]
MMIVQVVVVNAVFVCVGLGLLGLSDEALTISRDAQCLISVVLFTALSNPFSGKNEKPSGEGFYMIKLKIYADLGSPAVHS